MREIKRFGGFKLVMFFQDENPPHVHIKGPDFERRLACRRCAEQGREAGPTLG